MPFTAERRLAAEIHFQKQKVIIWSLLELQQASIDSACRRPHFHDRYINRSVKRGHRGHCEPTEPSWKINTKLSVHPEEGRCIVFRNVKPASVFSRLQTEAAIYRNMQTNIAQTLCHIWEKYIRTKLFILKSHVLVWCFDLFVIIVVIVVMVPPSLLWPPAWNCSSTHPC